MYYDDRDKVGNIVSDIAYKHTPDSIRDDAYRE